MHSTRWMIACLFACATTFPLVHSFAQTTPVAPTRAPRPVADSLPEGLAPLSPAERTALQNAACVAEVRRIATAAPRGAQPLGVVGGAQRLLEILSATNPQTDCLRLAARDTRVFLARTIEVEARARVTQIAREMASAAREATPPRLCPSAPAIPADLDSLRASPVSIPAAATGPGTPWHCIAVSFDEPVRYQYEVRTAPNGQSAEVIARGFPVPGQSRPDEIFAAIRLTDSSPPVLMRR